MTLWRVTVHTTDPKHSPNGVIAPNPTGGEWELKDIDLSQQIGTVVRCHFERDGKWLILDLNVSEYAPDLETYRASAWTGDNKGSIEAVVLIGSPYAHQLGIPHLIEKYEPLARLMR